MGSHQDVRKVVKRAPRWEERAGRRWIAILDIEGGARDPTVGQSLVEGMLVQDLRASDVHDNRGRFHECQLRSTDESLRLGGERQRDRQVVGATQQFGQALRAAEERKVVFRRGADVRRIAQTCMSNARARRANARPIPP